MREYDAIIIGGGHNGLILGNYLAKAGLKTLILERRLEIGGGLSTEEVTIPGFLHNLHSHFHDTINIMPCYKDLELEKETGRLILRTLDYIQFYFTTSTLISSDRVSFKYKLENYEDVWTMVTPSQIKMATYRELPPGRYTFRVMAANSDGIWDEKGASFTFDFSPGFTRSLLFKTILGLLMISVAALFFFVGRKYMLHRKAKNKYKDSLLDPEIVEQCMKKLSYVMDIEKLYQDDKLSLQVLSKRVSVTPHILSQVLNERMDKNFSDFVNSFRIEEAKKILQEADEDTSVLRVCYDVGFNSKSAFYRAFKKYTDRTPSQYQKELKEKK